MNNKVKHYILNTSDYYYRAVVKANNQKEAISKFYQNINDGKNKEDIYHKNEIECISLNSLFDEYSKDVAILY